MCANTIEKILHSGQLWSACELHERPSYASFQNDQDDTHFASYEDQCNLLEAVKNKENEVMSTYRNHMYYITIQMP